MFERVIAQTIQKITTEVLQERSLVPLLDILQEARIPARFKPFFETEVHWWLYNEALARAANKRFDYEHPELTSLLNYLEQVQFRHARFEREEFLAVLDSAVKLTYNYLCRPQTTLKWYIFRGQPVKPLNEVMLRFGAFIDYEYFRTVFIDWVDRKRAERPTFDAISATEFERVIRRVDDQLLLNCTVEGLLEMMEPLFDFIGEGPDQLVPVDALVIFFDDKNIKKLVDQLEGYRDRGGESVGREGFVALLDELLSSTDEEPEVDFSSVYQNDALDDVVRKHLEAEGRRPVDVYGGEEGMSMEPPAPPVSHSTPSHETPQPSREKYEAWSAPTVQPADEETSTTSPQEESAPSRSDEPSHHAGAGMMNGESAAPAGEEPKAQSAPGDIESSAGEGVIDEEEGGDWEEDEEAEDEAEDEAEASDGTTSDSRDIAIEEDVDIDIEWDESEDTPPQGEEHASDPHPATNGAPYAASAEETGLETIWGNDDEGEGMKIDGDEAPAFPGFDGGALAGSIAAIESAPAGHPAEAHAEPAVSIGESDTEAATAAAEPSVLPQDVPRFEGRGEMEDVRRFIDGALERKVVKKIFRKSREEYESALDQINGAATWRTASQVLDEIFIRYDVDPYSRTAIRFTDSVYGRYLSGTNRF